MKNTGRAPWARTMSLSFLAYSVNTDFSLGWIGHWLQSIMTAASNNLSRLVEDDVVVLVERIAADGVGPEIALDVVPIEAGAADRHHGVVIVVLVIGVGGLFQQPDMVGQAVVVIEEAVADEDFGLREIRSKRLVTSGLVCASAADGPAATEPAAASATKNPRKFLDISILPVRFCFAEPIRTCGFVVLIWIGPQPSLAFAPSRQRVLFTSPGYADDVGPSCGCHDCAVRQVRTDWDQPEQLPCRCKVWPLPRSPSRRRSAIR